MVFTGFGLLSAFFSVFGGNCAYLAIVTPVILGITTTYDTSMRTCTGHGQARRRFCFCNHHERNVHRSRNIIYNLLDDPYVF
jgi:hypothetical protein